MVNIVTGKINSFKTTYILTDYYDHRKGDGFAMLKTMKNNQVDHYTALQLSSQKEQMILARMENYPHLDYLDVIGPYGFIKNGFTWVEKEVQGMILKKVSPIYFDEVGILELQRKGFYQLVQELINSSLEIYLVIRSELVEKAIAFFDIKEYKIISR